MENNDILNEKESVNFNSSEQLKMAVNNLQKNNLNEEGNNNQIKNNNKIQQNSLHNSLDNNIVNNNKLNNGGNKNLQVESLKNKMNNNRNNKASSQLASVGLQKATGMSKTTADKIMNSKLGQKGIETLKKKYPALNTLDKLAGGEKKKTEEETTDGGGQNVKLTMAAIKVALLASVPIFTIIIFCVLFISASQIMVKSIGLGNADETSSSDAETKINSNINNTNDGSNNGNLNEEATDKEVSYNYEFGVISVSISKKEYAALNEQDFESIRKYQEADLKTLEDFYNGNLVYNEKSNMQTVVNFYLKLRDISVRYNKFCGEQKRPCLDLPLIMSTLMIESDDINDIFISNTEEKYDRKDIDNVSSSPLDPDYDLSSYVISKKSSAHDIEILAQHMVSQKDDGKYYYDKDKYNEFLKEFLEKKYFSEGETTNNSNNTCEVNETPFKKYELTEEQLIYIAGLCQDEQKSKKSAAFYASYIANSYEISSEFYSNLYLYVKAFEKKFNRGVVIESKDVDPQILEVVRNVLVNGYRNLPGYVDQYNCITCNGNESEITKIVIDDKSITNISGLTDLKNYEMYETKIYNTSNSTYTFYTFNKMREDIYGYTSEARRKKIGDFYYDFDTGKAENCTNDVSDISNEYVKAMLELANSEYNNKQGYNSGQKYLTALGYSIGTPWCAIFVSWITMNTKVNGKSLYPDIIPFWSAGAGITMRAVKNSTKSNIKFYYNDNCSTFKGKNGTSNSYSPKPGDFVTFSWDYSFKNIDTDLQDHIGIVEKYENGILYTIEGNASDTIMKIQYDITDCRIIAFGSWY